MTQLIAFRAVQGLGARRSDRADPGGDRRRRLRRASAAAIRGCSAPSSAIASVAGPAARRPHRPSSLVALDLLRQPAVGLVALAVLAATLPAVTARGRPVIDYLGAGLLAAACSALVLVTSLGGTTWEWGSPVILVRRRSGVLLPRRSSWRSSAARPSRCCRPRSCTSASSPWPAALSAHRRLRALRLGHLPAALLPDGRRLLAHRGRPAPGPDDGRAAGDVDRVRADHLPHRALQGLPDRWHGADGARAAAPLSARRGHERGDAPRCTCWCSGWGWA